MEIVKSHGNLLVKMCTNPAQDAIWIVQCTFQRLMERLFGDQQCQSLLLYLDDIVVFSSVDQHLARMEVVLSRLHNEGLKAKLSKCAFF